MYFGYFPQNMRKIEDVFLAKKNVTERGGLVLKYKSNRFIHCKLAKVYFKSSSVLSGVVNNVRGATLTLKQSSLL